MEKVNHNNVPEAIEFLIQKIESLESILLQSGKTIEPLKFDRIDKIEEACQILGFSKSKIYKLTMNNEIPHTHTKTGRLIFNRKDLMQWLEENIIEDKSKTSVLLSIAESASRKVK